MFFFSSDGSKPGFTCGCYNREEVIYEKERVSFWFVRIPAVLISEYLGDCFGYRFCYVRVFTFDDDKRDAVYEEDDIRDDVFYRSRDGDFKLPDGEEAVIFDVIKVDIFDGGALGSVFAVLVDGSEVDEQIGELMVLLDEG